MSEEYWFIWLSILPIIGTISRFALSISGPADLFNFSSSQTKTVKMQTFLHNMQYLWVVWGFPAEGIYRSLGVYALVSWWFQEVYLSADLIHLCDSGYVQASLT